MLSIKSLLGKNRRTALMRKNILFSFIIKGWTGIVFLLLVPITLKCLGEYQNGIWLTISSMLIWMDNMDIGLGNGLRNNLTSSLALGKTKEAREFVSNTFIMLILIITPAFLILLSLVANCDIYAFLNVDESVVKNLDKIIITALIFVCSTFIFKFIGNVYLGLQLPAVNNLLVSCGYTLSLIGTYILYYTHNGTLWNVAIINTCSPLVVYLLCYPYTFYYKYPQIRPRIRDFNIRTASKLFSIGIKFFLLQMSSSLVFMSSSLLMSRLYNPKEVTPYQITYRYFSIVLHFFTIICAPLWSATTDAYERGEIDWIKDSSKRTKKIIALSFIIIMALAILSQPIYSIWIGRDVTIPWSFTIGMAAYIAITIYSLAYCYYLNGMQALNLQLVCTLGGAALFFILTFVLSSLYHNAVTILLALCLSNIPSMVCNKLQFEKIVNFKATGIWKR